jgi:FtsP/CotA-like multicopper oxidase with cupredoxin domain
MASYPGSDYYHLAVVGYTEQMHSDLPATTQLRGYADLAGDGKAHYLGPLIIAQRDRPVRVRFSNLLTANSSYFLPVDTTIMGAGMGPTGANYSVNRAELHLHGGVTPWISDGTPHQWITPVGESVPDLKGVSFQNVPDMVGPGNSIASPAPGDAQATYYYTNQQSSRLMFYHDHSYGVTRLNVYAGEAAGYLLTDQFEEDLISGTNVSGINPSNKKVLPDLGGVYHYGIPLIIQDKTFVPSAAQLAAEDPTWNWGGYGNLWFPHVYMTNQNPSDLAGINAMGRWDYGPWFWPPLTAEAHGAVPCPSPIDPTQVCPGTPNPSLVPEAFMDTPLVNGTAYPVLPVQPKAYRFRILNASNDRTLNLQVYYADPTLQPGTPGYGKEVKMVPAMYDPSYPPTWPTDQRDGGVPDPATAGPAMIQIGTEGGFLPAPVVLPNTPIGYNYNRRDIVVLNVSNHTLLLGPAERADVIIDFSGVPAGSNLILYNDAPAPVPAFDSRYDYYTGDPDQTSTGGAPTTIPGYGPNTRTVMQFQVSGTSGKTFDLPSLNAALPVAFVASQPAPIVPESTYGSAYKTTYTDTYSTIQATSLTYTPAGSPSQITVPILAKTIQELFELNYGRMNATLGTELPLTNFNTQTTIPLGFTDPPTEILNDGQTQIWKITHNGVDTHAIHFHLFNVQLINRVGWDGAIRPPDANELGWKETVRMNPLEDVIVAIKPILPTGLPFAVPDSIRPFDPTTPLGSSTAGQFADIDPFTNLPITITNALYNFGGEYVWHCHLLGHEENDMMRPMVVRQALAGPVLTVTSTGANSVTLTWSFTPPAGESLYAVPTPTGPSATTYLVERTDPGTGDFVSLLPAGTSLTTNTYTDTSVSSSATYGYRVFAVNNYYYGELPASNSQVVTLGSNGAVTVSPTSVVTIADSKYRAYGAANPVFTGNIIGTLPAGATISYSTTATSASPVGSYPITMTVNGVPANSVTSTPGTLTITTAPLVVSADSQTRLFNLANPVLTGKLFGVMNSDGITATYSTTAAAASPAGAYPIIAALVDPNSKLSNYSVTNTPGTLDVTYYQLAAPQTLTIEQGQVGTATITMTPLNGFTGAVTFSCGALPIATTCNFTQQQLTGNLENNPVSTSLVITTTGPNEPTARREASNRLKPLYGALGLSAFGIVLSGSGRKRRAAMLILLSLALASLLVMPGCGESSIRQTPIGTSTVTVNVTASSAVAPSVAPNHQLQITLTVAR